MGSRASDGVYHALRNRLPDVRLVGDAMAPRRLHTGMLEGARAARAV
jgi:hypothetical protein